VARTGLSEGSQIDIEGEERAPVPSRIRTFNTIGCNVLLAVLYGFFATAHVAFAHRTGQWATAMPLVLQESLLVVLFLTRRRSFATSTRPIDWAIGIVAAFLPMLMRPIDPPGSLDWLGRPVQIAGLTLAVIGMSFLGRSIGVVPANRGVKTSGLYRLVRHPMYAAYVASYFGYIASYPSPRNALIGAATVVALYVRAILEERFLARDPAYRRYLKEVRWRFIPYVH
jgi:protein-S-isoprenylcysteine O-methyltransferase Ste14